MKRRERPRPALAMRAGSVVRLGIGGTTRRDVYHLLLTMRWRDFFALMALAYVAFNAVFASLYLIQPGSIGNAKHASFADAFFFSVQTMATVGFGVMFPATVYANLLVTAEALLGLAGFALATGLIFQRFSRPTARVLFSRIAVVTPYDGVPTLMFRCANERRNQILEADVHVALTREETSAEGMTLRRFHSLNLARSHNPLFSLSWTVMHPIDAASPLHGADAKSLAAQQAVLVVTLTGIDESLAQTIFARHDYDATEIRWGHRLVDILSQSPEGWRVVDYNRFHDSEPSG